MALAEQEKQLEKKVKNNYLVTQTKEKNSLMKKGATYNVSGKKEADTNLYQRWSNEHQISTQVIEKGQSEDKQMAFCTVRAIAPNGQFVESCVYFDYQAIKEAYLFDLIDKFGQEIIQDYDSTGKPILKPEYQKRLFKRFIRWRLFAVRDAESKAARRAQLKILNREWREPEELEYEQFEIETVEKSIQENQQKPKPKKNILNRLTTRKKSKPLPKNSIQDPDLERSQAIDFQEKLLEFATHPDLVFPPSDFQRLQDVASTSSPFTFLIKNANYGTFNFGHWNKDKLDRDSLTVKFGGNEKVTFQLNNVIGKLEIAKTSQNTYGDDITEYLKATGYGINWFIAEKSVYELMKKEEKEFQQSNVTNSFLKEQPKEVVSKNA